ncbi:type II toxin-antitoxin system RelE/ParE family toxin [Flavobacterium sp. DGU11]|uniref:Type II toxin-antitoxin system RelE/ParE family toxin n=1 Tax=Flavobacterium arundinis TaxID=3139143 RepID=A0ABU9HZL4_9FLAO
MGVGIYWTVFSRKQLRDIFYYYRDNASFPVAQKLISGIVQETKKLGEGYEIGQREELLIERNKDFRYLVFRNYKIVYRYNPEKERIDIADVFDTRQNPVKITRKK